jgi:hypothetical protein
VLQNFLGNLQTTKSEKSKFCSWPGDTKTVSATQKKLSNNKSFQFNPDYNGIMNKTCAYRILKVQVRISARELLSPTFTNYSVDNNEGL